MPDPNATTMQCQTCGTQFSSDDAAEAQNHAGHPLVKIEQA